MLFPLVALLLAASDWRSVVPPATDPMHAPMETPLLLSSAVPEGLELHVQPAGAAFEFAQIRYGDPGSPRVALALDRPKEGGWRLFADVNADRALDPDELVPGPGPAWELDLFAWAEEDGVVQRVPHRVSIRVGRTGLLLGYATLGYLEGTVELDGRRVAARRVDADGNGLFTDPLDRLWLDLDGDGRWSVFDEQFLYAPVLRLGAARYALHSDRLGRALAVEKVEGLGRVRFRMDGADGKPRADVLALQATLMGKDGSTVGVLGHDVAVEAPTGEYRLCALSLTFAAPGGSEPWNFAFSESGGRGEPVWHALARDAEQVLDPVGALDFSIAPQTDGARVGAGEPLSARIKLFTGDGLLINSCTRGSGARLFGGNGPHASCSLLGEGGTLAVSDSGFA